MSGTPVAGIAATLLLLVASATAGCGSCESGFTQRGGDGGATGDAAPNPDGDPTGDVTCSGDSCPSGCAGTPCGANNSLCCTGKEICINQSCATPGKKCKDSSKCPKGKYCEPTIGRCLPRSNQSTCKYRPPAGQFTPTREGSAPDVDENGNTYNRSISAPTVADIDDDDKPEIAVILYRNALSGALVAVFNGEDRSLVDAGAVEQIQPNSAGLAVGQLDPSTPQLEIVAPKNGGGLVALKLDGGGSLSTWWSSDSGNLGDVESESAPAIADLDGDGSAEIVFGFSVVDARGNIWNGLDQGPAGGQGSNVGLTSVVDLDGSDGMNGNRDLEIVAGNRAMKLDGSMLWDASGSVSDGFSAVGDFGNDGSPEVVTVTEGEVYVLDGRTGNVEFGPKSIPGGGEGGPPTIADFDNDDYVEFSAAGQGKYTVYDLGCGGPGAAKNKCSSGRSDGILWAKDVQDLSSSRTGSSVFDFEADGQAEVVYNDECFLRVFNGETGKVLYERANTSRTGSEYPIVVDVDSDNNSEIVVVSNNDQIDRDNCEDNYQNYPTGGTTGVFVYADAEDNWVPTRELWNEHAYHITNIKNDGSIPKQETLHYKKKLTNTFRLNVQRGGRFDAPDLVITNIEGSCTAEGLKIEVTIANKGRIGVAAGVPVALYAGTPGNASWIADLKTTRPLRPGASETLSHTWKTPPVGAGSKWKVRAVADSNKMKQSTEQECKEDNNSDTATGTSCECRALGASCSSNAQCCSGVCSSGGGMSRCVGQ